MRACFGTLLASLCIPLLAAHGADPPPPSKPNTLILYLDDMEASKDMPPMLVNLATDRGEQNDLAAANPNKMAELQSLRDQWNASMLPPRWEDRRWDDGNDKTGGKKNNQAKKDKKRSSL